MSKELDPGEVVIARARPGWGGFAREAVENCAIVMAVMALLRWWGDGAFPPLAEWLIWVTIFPISFFALSALFWCADRWVLTDQRVIDVRRQRSVPLATLKPVRRGFFSEANLIGYDGTRLRLRAVPGSNGFLAQIEAARQAATEKAPHV